MKLQKEVIRDWNDNPVNIVKSKSGVIALVNPLQNLVSTGVAPWPTSEIVQKLYRSSQHRAFTKEATSHLGYYCDLQSVHSEDAITWSVFGTLSRSSDEVKFKWLSSLFRAVDLPGIMCTKTEITLWRRIPHPDKLVSGGPEIDVIISTDNSVVLVEAKWLSEVGTKQGEEKNKDQIQLRGEYLQKLGHIFYPNATHLVVLGIAPRLNSIKNTTPAGTLFRETTWSVVCGIEDRPLYNEIQRYYHWKKEHSTKFE